MKIENIDINLLTPYKNNAKKHPKKQIEQIMNSIREFGMNDPIGIWGKDNIIVEGHGRYLACKKLGMTEVSCIRLDNLTDEQRKAYTLAHNKVAEFNAVTGSRYKSYEKTLEKFNEKYANADHEYGITIDEDGYVHRHIEGGKTSVGISGSKGQMIVHNHPSGGNFSDSDLIVVASGSEKGIVATGSKKTYTFTKTKNFKSKEFTKAVKKAQWPVEYDYDKGADWWLRQNAKKYGYKYTAQKTKGIKH